MKGLLFTPAMAQAVCQGRKTVTRRVMDLPENFAPLMTPKAFAYLSVDGMWVVDNGAGMFLDGIKCDYKAGELRCLLTTWAVAKRFDDLKPTELPDSHWDGSSSWPISIWHAGLGEKPKGAGKSRPGRFLPNALRPLMPLYEIASVRAERVQDITEEDAKAEGIERITQVGLMRAFGWRDYLGGKGFFGARESFSTLWDSINVERGFGWESNPWVQRVEFKEVKP